MGYIQEEIKHKTIKDLTLTIEERADGEYREPFEIISLETPFIKSYTPDDIITIGTWLITNASLIKERYTSTGKLKKGKSKITQP